MGAWRDLALDTGGDLVVEAGDFRLVEGATAIAQECRLALGLWLGEFPFDTTLGTDWDRLLDRKGVSDAEVAAEVRRVLGRVQGVASVDGVTVTRDTATRRVAVSVQVRTEALDVLTVQATGGV